MAQLGDHPLQRIQHRSLVSVGGRMRPQRGERRGVQVVEPGTAVEQQGLAEHAPQPVLDAGAVAVSPPIEQLAGPPQRLLDGVFTKDQAGQVKSIKRAQPVEVGESAEQVGQRHHERPHRRLGWQRLRSDELPRAAATQPGPLPRRPTPPAAAGVGAVLQHDRRGLPTGAAEPDVVTVMQPGHGRLQRLGQPGQRPPVQRVSPRDAHGPVAAQPLPPEREQRRGLAVEQRDPAIPAPVPPKAP